MYAVPLLDDYVGDTRTALLVLLGAVMIVLFVACATVANLLLAGAMDRAKDLAVRAALGADRRRLVRQLLTESSLLAAIGGLAGVGVAELSFGTLARLVPEPLADLSNVGLDGRVLAMTAGLTMLTGLLFGLAPAWRASRVDPTAADGHRNARGLVGGTSRLRNGLVIAEIALATVLLVGAGLFLQSFRTISRVDLGFRPDHILTAQVQLPRLAYREFSARQQFVRNVLARVRALPGVQSAAYTSAVPLVWKGGSSGFVPEGLPIQRELAYDAVNRVVSPAYMETVGMTLREGRFFSDLDNENGQPVAIINERMAKQYWPGIDAIGRRFTAGSEGRSPQPRTIVGIVANTSVMGIDQPAKAEMFFPIEQSSNNWMWPRDLVIQVSGDPSAIAGDVRKAVWAVDPNQPVSKVQTLDDIVGTELESRRMQMTLMTAFAGLALLLAAVGVYGVLSYSVSMRTREIGLRLALGGEPGRVRTLVVRQGMTLAAAGLVIGLSVAAAAASLVGTLLFHVSAHDPATFMTQAAVLTAACLLAAYLPARRASRVDPMAALRAD
jgi:predicted permease